MSNKSDNFVIDMGNSSIKVGQFQGSQLIKDWVFQSLQEVVSLVNQSAAKRIIICSVASEAQDLASQLTANGIIILDASTPIPFENHYKTKNTLGVDRIAALAGAECINSGKNNLVIDMGSCITYDFLDKNHKYQGGSISPGIDLRFKAMNDYTKRLPLITKYNKVELVGKTTKDAMVSGVINGISAEVDGIISRYLVKWPDLEVIMCGRAANSFESNLKATIFASPKLVLIGLNRILEYNEQS
ncbi:type III pantothenate kinase [Reichenbachiella faecimaris]|uniref:Type III pantothenate kinase n=1 Tax=Reichenbachiella faecimaris TaxID=692418 RepID=A0A1W2GE46_REIFA|nr:type III pantothenate kinase [Reichenbachiella faecimaris]SMD34925.1 type III pantothenate kinase [Reichenbachiella faecimaris]